MKTADPRIATPEHECIYCQDILYEGEICTCQDEDEEIEDLLMVRCNACRGSGEGMADGTTCRSCHGSGEIPA